MAVNDDCDCTGNCVLLPIIRRRRRRLEAFTTDARLTRRRVAVFPGGGGEAVFSTAIETRLIY